MRGDDGVGEGRLNGCARFGHGMRGRRRQRREKRKRGDAFPFLYDSRRRARICVKRRLKRRPSDDRDLQKLPSSSFPLPPPALLPSPPKLLIKRRNDRQSRSASILAPQQTTTAVSPGEGNHDPGSEMQAVIAVSKLIVSGVDYLCQCERVGGS